MRENDFYVRSVDFVITLYTMQRNALGRVALNIYIYTYIYVYDI